VNKVAPQRYDDMFMASAAVAMADWMCLYASYAVIPFDSTNSLGNCQGTARRKMRASSPWSVYPSDNHQHLSERGKRTKCQNMVGLEEPKGVHAMTNLVLRSCRC